MTTKATPAMLLVLNSGCLTLSQNKKSKFELLIDCVTDWKEAAKMIIERQGAGLVYKKLQEFELLEKIPSEAVVLLKQARFKTMARQMVLAEHFRRVAVSLSRNGIEIIAMKGIYLSEFLYKEPGLRQCSDIDLLVREEHEYRAIRILMEMGYQTDDLIEHIPYEILNAADVLHSPPMSKDGVSIELHTRLVRRTAPFTINIDEAWNSAIQVTLNGAPVMVFSPEYQVLTVAQHLEKHFRQGKFQMSGFFDLANMLTNNPFNVDWIKLHELCQKTGSLNLMLNFFAILSEYMEIEVPRVFASAKIDNDYRKIFEDVIEKGISTRINIVKTLFANSIDTSLRFRITRILFLFFPPSNYIRYKYNLKPSDPVIWYYFKRIWKRIVMIFKSKY
jgi:hypothetical protein